MRGEAKRGTEMSAQAGSSHKHRQAGTEVTKERQIGFREVIR